MISKKYLVPLFLVAILSTLSPFLLADAASEKPKLENLMRAVLEGTENTEVIVSRVSVPPNTSLPRHWHPGEEFAYILEGESTLWMEGDEKRLIKSGELVKIPFKRVHTVTAGPKGFTVLVFRVHQKGQPERVMVK